MKRHSSNFTNKTFKIIVLFLFVFTCRANSASLTIQNPDFWQTYNGKITEMNVEVTPVGTYMQYDFYMTFAANSGNFNNSDSVEIQYYFNLPTDAIITDSWLWVENVAVQAYLTDSWTATQIYEGIVQRRKDPSLLKKTGQNSYSYQIYPMLGNGTRKIKMSVLIPSVWTINSVNSFFPTSLLQGISTSNLPQKITFLCNEDSMWKNSEISAYTSQMNQEYEVSISEVLSPNFSVSYALPTQNNSFITTYSKDGENYFQCIVSPFSETISAEPKELILVFDCLPYSSNNIEMISYFKAYILKELEMGSKVNVVFNNKKEITRLAKVWINNDDEIAFANSLSLINYESNYNNYDEYGNTLELLKYTLDFSKAYAPNAKIILFSSVYDDYQDKNIASIINSLYKTYDVLKPIDILFYDIYGQNNYYYYYDYYYYNSHATLSELARRTFGNFMKISTLFDIEKTINSLYYNKIDNLSDYELDLNTKNGFCYDEIIKNTEQGYLDKTQPIIITGKYYGEFPLTFDLKYLENNELVSKTYVFSVEDVVESDSILKTIWAGQTINILESSGMVINDDIMEIIDISAENRVLSRYTAFLALEPTMNLDSLAAQVDENGNVWLPIDNDWERVLTNVDSVSLDSDSEILTIVSNTNFELSAKVTLPNDEELQSIKVYNSIGVLVTEFTELEFSLDKNSISKGVYILVIETDKNIYAVKFIL